MKAMVCLLNLFLVLERG